MNRIPPYDPAWLRQQRDAHQVFTRDKVIELLAQYELLKAEREQERAAASTAKCPQREYASGMEHKLTPALVTGIGVLALVSGFYLARLTLPTEYAPACIPNPAVTLSDGAQCLNDHSLEYRTIPKIEWKTRGPRQERPGMPLVK